MSKVETSAETEALARTSASGRLAYFRNPEVLKWIWFVLFVAAVAPFKIQLSTDAQDPGWDGGYYTDVAQHVRDGNGLKTDISLYHQGYTHFPHPTSIYPLWPLLYGYAGKVFKIPEVGVWLSTAFYFMSLFLAFGWVLRVFPGDLFPRVFPGFQAAHVFVLMLGLNVHFFHYTSMPYTEGLANVILFGFLLRSKTLWSSPKWWAGAEIGAWLALAFLARSQLFILALAGGVAWIWAGALCRNRLKTAIQAVACVGVAGLLIAPYWFYISSFLHDPGLGTMLRFDQAQATTALAPLPTSVETDGILGYLADRAGGFLVAFGFSGIYAYRNVYGLCQYAPLLALVIMTVMLGRRIKAERLSAIVTPAWAWLRQRENLHYVFLVVFALGSFLSLHTIHHAVFIKEWVFSSRHSLSAMALFFLALLWLLSSRSRLGMVLAVFLLASSAYTNAVATYNMVQEQSDEAERAKDSKPALVAWLNKERAKRGRLTVVVPVGVGQSKGWLTPGISYHWTYQRTTAAELRTLFDDFGADYLITNHSMRRWPLRKPGKYFRRKYRRIARNLSGYEIWERKPAPTADSIDSADPPLQSESLDSQRPLALVPQPFEGDAGSGSDAIQDASVDAGN